MNAASVIPHSRSLVLSQYLSNKQATINSSIVAPDIVMMQNTTIISYDSSTNKRLRNSPSQAQSLAQNAVQSCRTRNINPSSSSSSPFDNSSSQNKNRKYRTIIGLGPGRSGTKSIHELLSYQRNVVHCEHEMIVPRVFPRSRSGHIVVSTCSTTSCNPVSSSIMSTSSSISTTASGQVEGEEPARLCEAETDGTIMLSQQNNKQQQQQQYQPRNKQVKGSWGADRRLEWDVPKLARGEPSRSDEDEALWRVLRLFEQQCVFDGWVNDYHCRNGSNKYATNCDDDHGNDVNGDGDKPKKLGTRGWREYNNATTTNCNDDNLQSPSNCNVNVTTKYRATQQQKQKIHPTHNQLEEASSIPIIATVSSVGLAYTHEYIALNPSVKILIVLRPCEEVVASFMMKSRGRNHWQKHTTHYCNNKQQNKMNEAEKGKSGKVVQVQRDKTWDNAFPNISNDECHLVMSTTTIDNNTPSSTPSSTNEQQHHQYYRPEKIWAIRAYCKLYSEVANQLAHHYPDNVRVFDMHSVLNDADVQIEMLKWCGFDEPVVDTCLHLNKKK